MKTDEIRKKKDEVSAALIVAGGMEGAAFILQASNAEALLEIATQIAEANEHLKCIAHPPICIEGTSWVRLTDGKDIFIIDSREVTGVAQLDSGIGSDRPTVQIGMKGQPWSKAADGTVEEVCKKLGIPTKEG